MVEATEYPRPPVAPTPDEEAPSAPAEKADHNLAGKELDGRPIARAEDQEDVIYTASNVASEAPAASSPDMMVTLGIGMGVAFVALLGVTFFILKPMR